MTSLRNLLPLIDKEKYTVDVYAVTAVGTEYVSLDPYASVLNRPGKAGDSPKSRSLKTIVIDFLKRVKRLSMKFGLDPSATVFKRMAAPLSAKHYDYVIAYQEGQATLMASFIEAPVKIAWVHSMYSRFKSTSTGRNADDAYRSYNKIICVSNAAADDMKATSPELADKINVVYNALDVERIRTLSGAEADMPGGINIVSVGRVDPVKRFSLIPSIAAFLKHKGLAFHWTIIGGSVDDDEKAKLLHNVSEYGVSDVVDWVGQKTNPYPYIGKSDLLVCLSSSETFNYTLAEAIALGTPVVTADFPCAREFVDDGVTGLICSIDKMPGMIYDILTDKLLYGRVKDGIERALDRTGLIMKQLSLVLD